MKVEKNKVVAVGYALEVEGKIADRSAPGQPLEYIHGSGMLLPKFEAALEGKEPGEGFDFVLSSEDGYGTFDPRLEIDLPKTAFAINGQIREDLLVPGRVIPMLNQAGQVVQGTVVAVNDVVVTMDFNHPMAGKTLHFTGTVESVREATDKELREGLHGEYLPPEEHECPHGKGHCHREDHEEGECCGKGHGDGECCGKGKGEGDCNCEGEGCCHQD